MKNAIRCAAVAAVAACGSVVGAAEGESGRVTAMDMSEGVWDVRPAISADGKTFDVPLKVSQSYLTPKVSRTNDLQVTQYDIRYDFDSPPDEAPIFDPGEEVGSVCVVGDSRDRGRFACYDNGTWVTNTTLEVVSGKNYTVEIAVDNSKLLVTYRVRPEGGEFVTLFTGKAPHKSSGEIGIIGTGQNVREIRWNDR